MMKWTRYMLLMPVLLVQALSSCSLIDEPEWDNGVDTSLPPQQVDLIICVGDKASKTRQMSANAATRAATFQGMEGLVAIPFHTGGVAVASTDAPLIDVVGATEESNRVAQHNNYYVDRCYFMTGTDRMLVYGKSKPSHDDQSYDPAVHGKLSDLPTIRTKTENITFSLASIRETTEAHTDAIALANYMTTIANTPGWSTTTDPTLKSYYLDFIRMGSEGAGLMSGAAANIKAFVAALKALLTGSDELSTAIKNKIDATDISSNTYPRSIGLPDGAAVIRWMGTKFEARTTTTTLDNINGINRYTYPAELVFFTDSPIRTSAEEVSKTTYQTTDKLWSAFLDTYYNGSTAVNTNTKAVAVENPLQYGVANLQVTLTGMAATLKDAKDEVVSNTSMTTLPLTGVIIGGQHTVGHNMKPRGAHTDVDGRFIYETNIVSEDAGKSINTLVLQSYDGEKVPVILELENWTGKSFTGKDGIVYPDTRFYLIGLIDPDDKKVVGNDYTYRVFTQDYTTIMSMSIASLANAYTCMPDLLAPRLEVGVQVVTKWIQATTTNVEL